MRPLFIYILVFAFASCKQSATRQSFSSADSLVIHFKDEQAGVVTRTVKTGKSDPRFRQAINRVIEFIDSKETELFKCGYDGKMFFYNDDNKMQEVDFKMKNDSCNHFAFMLDGKLMSTKMSREAADFFDALERNAPVYD